MKHKTIKKGVAKLGNNETWSNEKKTQLSKKVVENMEAKQEIMKKGIMEQGATKKKGELKHRVTQWK